MAQPSVLPLDRVVYDIELLRELRGRKLSNELEVLCVIGAHRFDELPLVNSLFPALKAIYLFEPQAEPLAVLRQLACSDSRLKVFPFAVSDTDGTARFNIASNNGESSSLLQLGTHRSLFPDVSMQSAIEVPTRRLNTVLKEQGLQWPDVMIIDVQGAEHQVIKSFSTEVLQRLRLLYTEVSTEAVYENAGVLAEVESLLAPRFVNVGFAAINPDVPVHGNVIFVARPDLEQGLMLTLRERVRRGARRLRQRLRSRKSH